MKQTLRSADCAAERMAGGLPKLFVVTAGVLLFSGLSGAILLSHEVLDKTFGTHSGGLDEPALQLMLHRNMVSTVLPQTFRVVHDKS